MRHSLPVMSIDAHADTSTGELVLDVGHIDPVDLKVTIGYDIARALSLIHI